LPDGYAKRSDINVPTTSTSDPLTKNGTTKQYTPKRMKNKVKAPETTPIMSLITTISFFIFLLLVWKTKWLIAYLKEPT